MATIPPAKLTVDLDVKKAVEPIIPVAYTFSRFFEQLSTACLELAGNLDAFVREIEEDADADR